MRRSAAKRAAKGSVGLIACAWLVLSATAASATLAIDVNIVGVFTDTTFATPVAGSSIEPSGDTASATLAAGQGILLTIDISNLNGDLVTDLFSTIIFQGDQVNFLGGTAIAEILVGGPVPAPTSLVRLAQPMLKVSAPNPPGVAGDVWLQSTAFASLGTTGTGPDLAAVALFFEVTGAAGADQIEFILTTTAGDFISGTPTLSGAVINVVPEPGTALLLGLGLGGLGGFGVVAGRRHRR